MRIPFIPLLLLMASANAQTDSSTPPKFFGVQTVKIVFKFTNGAQSGEKTIVFDDWGRKEREEVTTVNDTATLRKMYSAIRSEMDSIPQSPLTDSAKKSFGAEIPAVQHNLRIRDSGQVYSIDLDRNIGYVTPDLQLMPDSTFLEQTEVRQDTLLGRRCRVVRIMDAFFIWYWQKIPVKKEMVQKIEGMKIEEYAIDIDENYKVKPGDFKVPASVKIQ